MRGLIRVPPQAVVFAVALVALAACTGAEEGNGQEAAANDKSAEASANATSAPESTEVPLADRPAPDPIVGGTPLVGEFDPDIMTVTLAGDRLEVMDAKRAWPLRLYESTYDFTRRGLAMFGTPSLSKGPDDCPAGKLTFLTYANGLELSFQDGKLAGYWVKEGSRGVSTESGIRPGSPRSVLGKRKIEEASFGKLVDIDGTIAVLDDRETKVTDLYAGALCIYD